jgi:regulator of cell morphogenesis and NO signaling
MITADKTMRDIVLEYNGTAGVLEKYGLDFCCQGMRSLEEACKAKNLDTEKVLEELKSGFVDEPGFNRYQKWDVSFLCDYIVNHHHTYVKEALPLIGDHLVKVVNAHGERHPEMLECATIFSQVAQELQMHMMKEEQVLFPYIAQMDHARKRNSTVAPAHFGTVNHPIERMEAEHEFAGDAMDRIRVLLSDYTPPEDACTTMRLTYNELAAFEHDLHQHVFLENAILFPRAKKLEMDMHFAD